MLCICSVHNVIAVTELRADTGAY